MDPGAKFRPWFLWSNTGKVPQLLKRFLSWKSAPLFVRLTFLEAGEPEQFDKAEVVAGHQHGAAVVGVHRVHVVDGGVFGPDAVHLWPNDARPRHPVDPLRLLFRHQLPRYRRQEGVKGQEVREFKETS